ncbi:S-layer protein [Candidatus Micrarchaeota archaeon]|nr:S-layer protein [Candidatus Micrarchaeota archaeon]
MDLLVKENKSMPVKTTSMDELNVLLNKTRWRLAQTLASSPDYPGSLSKKLGIGEQLVYYHIRKLEKAGLVRVERTEQKQGGVAKYFSLIAPAFAVVARDSWQEQAAKGSAVPAFLRDFVRNGTPDFSIIVGSPDPHGPNRARARDTFVASDIALRLGAYCKTTLPVTKLDTECREADLHTNLIIIGGPITNMISERFMPDMPVRFSERKTIVSDLSGKEYSDPTNGIIVKSENSLEKGRKILILAGISLSGTRAACLALSKYPDMNFRNSYNKDAYAKVVDGIDLDGNGIVDDVEVKE